MARTPTPNQDRSDTLTPRPFGKIKPDGRRHTDGVHSNGGKQLVVRALGNRPTIKVVRGEGYVLVGKQQLPPTGNVTLSHGNAKDVSKHFSAPARLFTEDWREPLPDEEV